MRITVLLFTCAALAACGGGGTDDGGLPDGATDDGGDAGHDAGPRDLGMDLGHDAGTDMAVPTCTTGCNIVEIGAGFEHSCARRENGQVLCWGRNYWGELGDGMMRHPGSDCLLESGMAVDCSQPPVVVSGLTDAQSLVSHYGPSTCAKKMDGTYACWGWAFALGTGMSNPTVRWTATAEPMFGSASQVGITWVRACIVNADHTVSCMGSNDYGELGDGTRTSHIDITPVMGVTNAVQVATGDHTCARLMDGTLQCWGANDAGQLGDGMSHMVCTDGHANPDCSLTAVTVATIDDAIDVGAGSGFSCAIRSDHSVWCWGANQIGQLGVGDLVDHHMPVQVPGITNVMQMSVGDDDTCVVLSSGAVKCWGYNRHGTVGDGVSHMLCTSGSSMYDCSPNPVSVVEMGASGTTPITDGVQVEVGQSHACLLRATHDVFCWGANDKRQTSQTSAPMTYPDVTVPARVTFPM